MSKSRRGRFWKTRLLDGWHVLGLIRVATTRWLREVLPKLASGYAAAAVVLAAHFLVAVASGAREIKHI